MYYTIIHTHISIYNNTYVYLLFIDVSTTSTLLNGHILQHGQEILISFSILDSIPPDRLYNIRGTNGRLAGKSLLVSRFHKRERRQTQIHKNIDIIIIIFPIIISTILISIRHALLKQLSKQIVNNDDCINNNRELVV